MKRIGLLVALVASVGCTGPQANVQKSAEAVYASDLARAEGVGSYVVTEEGVQIFDTAGEALGFLWVEVPTADSRLIKIDYRDGDYDNQVTQPRKDGSFLAPVYYNRNGHVQSDPALKAFFAKSKLAFLAVDASTLETLPETAALEPSLNIVYPVCTNTDIGGDVVTYYPQCVAGGAPTGHLHSNTNVGSPYTQAQCASDCGNTRYGYLAGTFCKCYNDLFTTTTRYANVPQQYCTGALLDRVSKQQTCVHQLGDPGSCTTDFGANGWTSGSCGYNLTTKVVNEVNGPTGSYITVNTGATAPNGTVSVHSSNGTVVTPALNGTSVSVVRQMQSGYSFTGWSGGTCSGTAATCTVTMNQARSVTATFTHTAADNDGYCEAGEDCCDESSTNACGTLSMPCFVAGTPVTMADGSSRAIESIKVGDSVMAYDTATKTMVPSRVTETFAHPNTTEQIVLVNGTLQATPNHPFYANGQWVRADQLKVGDSLVSMSAGVTGGMGAMKLSTSPTHLGSIEALPGSQTVYNLEVDNQHDYFAGGILVHNKYPCDVYGPWSTSNPNGYTCSGGGGGGNCTPGISCPSDIKCGGAPGSCNLTTHKCVCN